MGLRERIDTYEKSFVELDPDMKLLFRLARLCLDLLENPVASSSVRQFLQARSHLLEQESQAARDGEVGLCKTEEPGEEYHFNPMGGLLG